ncbi:ATP-dependent Clp protease adaptor ClpS [candidate division KSB1 bacterium]|nr:ATP-dependent Clp protease adaptor ClpS [candidate division KSB1 bacterium]
MLKVTNLAIAEGGGRRAEGNFFDALCAIPFALCPLPSVLSAAVSPYEDEDVLIDDDIGTRIGEPWKVILYNDDIHTFDEVILQLQKALKCSAQRAEKIAFEAHNRGKAIAFSGEFDECFRVAGILREIQLIVEIEG